MFNIRKKNVEPKIIKKGQIQLTATPHVEISLRDFFKNRGYSAMLVVDKFDRSVHHVEVNLDGKNIKSIIKDFQDFNRQLTNPNPDVEASISTGLRIAGVPYVVFEQAFLEAKSAIMTPLRGVAHFPDSKRLALIEQLDHFPKNDPDFWKNVAKLANNIRMEVHETHKQAAKVDTTRGIKGFIKRTKMHPAESSINDFLESLVKDKRITSTELKQIKKDFIAAKKALEPKADKPGFKIFGRQ